MKKHSDNNVKDIYSFGAVIYVAERTLLVGIQRYFENEPEQRKEVRTYKKKMIEALKAEEILLVDNSKANTKKKNGKRFYEIDYKRLKYFCQLQDAKQIKQAIYYLDELNKTTHDVNERSNVR